MDYNNYYQGFIRSLRADWADAELNILTLRKGIFNHPPHLVEVKGHSYVVRRFGKGTDFFVDREVERENLKRLERLGIVPKLVEFKKEHGAMIFQYIHGRDAVQEDFRDVEILSKIVQAVRSIHTSGIRLVNELRPFEAAERYKVRAKHLNAHLMQDESIGIIHKVVRMIEGYIATQNISKTPCHNDLVSGNFIITDDEAVRVIDWEFAAMGDPLYDLANFITELQGGSINVLDEEGEEMVLKMYFGDIDRRFRQRIDLYKLLARYLALLWGIIQSKESDIDYDYEGYAKHQLQICLEILNSTKRRYPALMNGS